MNAKRGPISTSKLIGILFLLAVPCSIGLWLWVRSAIARSWTEMERRVEALHNESRSRSGLRPVLRGTSVPTSAWESYDSALQAIMGVPLPRGDDEATIFDDTLKAFAPALEIFRRASVKLDGQRYRDWRHAETPKEVDRLARLLVGQARSLVMGKKDRDAAQLLLDILQFCGDAERNGSWEDAVQADRWRSVALTRLKDLIRRGALSKEDLLEVSHELDTLENALPSLRDTLVNSAMDQGFMFLDLARKGDLLPKGEGNISWRLLFSERLATASAFGAELEFMLSLAEANEKPWVESLRLQELALAKFLSGKNPIVTRYGSWASTDALPLLLVTRVQRAQIRLLRLAAHYKVTGKNLELEDPFGGKLRSSKTGDRVTVWSVGPDGVDDGGVDDGSGDWTLPRHLRGTPVHRFPGDIVITVEP